jgi:hypothetical protein
MARTPQRAARRASIPLMFCARNEHLTILLPQISARQKRILSKKPLDRFRLALIDTTHLPCERPRPLTTIARRTHTHATMAA